MWLTPCGRGLSNGRKTGAHLAGRDDDLVSVAPLLDRSAGRFAGLIETEPSAEALSALRAAETIGQPLGSAFLNRLAPLTARDPTNVKANRSVTQITASPDYPCYKIVKFTGGNESSGVASARRTGFIRRQSTRGSG